MSRHVLNDITINLTNLKLNNKVSFDDNDGYSTPKKTGVSYNGLCTQTSCNCPRAIGNVIHCKSYPRMNPCFGKKCDCF